MRKVLRGKGWESRTKQILGERELEGRRDGRKRNERGTKQSERKGRYVYSESGWRKGRRDGGLVWKFRARGKEGDRFEV